MSGAPRSRRGDHGFALVHGAGLDTWVWGGAHSASGRTDAHAVDSRTRGDAGGSERASTGRLRGVRIRADRGVGRSSGRPRRALDRRDDLSRRGESTVDASRRFRGVECCHPDAGPIVLVVLSGTAAARAVGKHARRRDETAGRRDSAVDLQRAIRRAGGPARGGSHARVWPLYTDAVEAAVPDVPSRYVKTTRDEAVPPVRQDETIGNVRTEGVSEIDAGHVAMLGHPREVAAELRGFDAPSNR